MPTIEKKGYKYTEEFGYIPEDWEVDVLSSFGDCIIGLTYAPEDVKDYGTLVLRSSNIQNNTLVYDDNVYVQKDIPEKLMVQNGDILVCVRNGSRALIGKSALITEKDIGHTFGAFMSVYRTKINAKYMYQLFQSDIIKTQIEAGLGATINQITNATMNDFRIPVPPLREQEKIAEVLGDFDSLIDKTQQLINKKKDLKTATMQKLLTPKQDWEEKKLGDICSYITTGKLDANAMVVNGEYRFYTCAKEYYKIDTYAFEGESLLVSGNGANVGYIHYYNGKFNAYQRTYVLQKFSENIFYIKCFMDKFLSDRIASEVNAGNTPYIKLDTITDMLIKYPKNNEEQENIATILSDMDSEIEALEKELNKYKDLKTGMMQQLLTGKVRLI